MKCEPKSGMGSNPTRKGEMVSKEVQEKAWEFLLYMLVKFNT